MNEMVERVARAIQRVRGPKEHWDLVTEATRQLWISDARAAIAAMRDPTEAITEGMHLAWDRREFAPGPFTLEKLWRAGIDAALAEDGAPPA